MEMCLEDEIREVYTRMANHNYPHPNQWDRENLSTFSMAHLQTMILLLHREKHDRQSQIRKCVNVLLEWRRRNQQYINRIETYPMSSKIIDREQDQEQVQDQDLDQDQEGIALYDEHNNEPMSPSEYKKRNMYIAIKCFQLGIIVCMFVYLGKFIYIPILYSGVIVYCCIVSIHTEYTNLFGVLE